MRVYSARFLDKDKTGFFMPVDPALLWSDKLNNCFVNFITLNLISLIMSIMCFFVMLATKFSFYPPIINVSFENLFHFIECLLFVFPPKVNFDNQ